MTNELSKVEDFVLLNPFSFCLLGQIFRHKWSDSSLSVQTDPRNVIENSYILSVGEIPLKTCWKDDMKLSCIYRNKVVRVLRDKFYITIFTKLILSLFFFQIY